MCIIYYLLQKAVNTMYVQAKNSKVVVLWQAWISDLWSPVNLLRR